MKIYFSLSLSQMDDNIQRNAKKIVSHLKDLGHSVYPDQIYKKDSEHYQEQSPEESLEAQKELTKLKKIADLVVVEVSKQSLGIGQEIALALSMNKPVVALYEEGNQPHLLRDEGGDLLLLAPYNKKNMEEVLADAVDYAASHQDVRFNF